MKSVAHLPQYQRAFASRAVWRWACTLTLLVALASAGARAQSVEPAATPGNFDVALITFGPGAEVFERFGHNAIEIRDRSSGIAQLYNYGIFDLTQPDFLLNFARGIMIYRVAAGDPAEELPYYVSEGRWIVRQELNLTTAQSQKLADFLSWNVLPENALYRYDFFRANCSTRTRDALDAALGGTIKDQTIAPSRGFTYRMDADRLMEPDLPVMLLIDAGLGPFADRRLSYWDESFVPTELMRHMRDISVRDEAGVARPLVRSEVQVAAARVAEAPEFPPRWTWFALAIGMTSALLLLGLAQLRKRAWARVAFSFGASSSALLLGIGGIVLIGLWLLTAHVSAWRNENLLLFNPLSLLLLPMWLRSFGTNWRPTKFSRGIAIAIASCSLLAWFIKILPGFIQDNGFWIALLLPIHWALALIAVRQPSMVVGGERDRPQAV